MGININKGRNLFGRCYLHIAETGERLAGSGLLKIGQRVMRWQGDQFCCLSAVLEKTQKTNNLLY
jgi:hypothetical protein